MTFKTLMAATVLASSGLLATNASAATLVVDVADIASYGTIGNTNNAVLSYFLGAGATVTDIAYDVTIQAYSPSWLSEIAVAIEDSAQFSGVYLTPGFADSNSGIGSYAGGANLVDLGLAFSVGADGLLRLEFFDSFDDSGVTPDGLWLSGSITITHDGVVTPAIPEPGTWAMLIGGFALTGAAMRRRRTSIAFA